MSALPLPIRNRLAELVLEGFDDPDSRATLGSVARACVADPATVDRADVQRLAGLGWFEAAGPGRVRLLGAHRGHRGLLAERAGRAVAVLDDWRDPSAEPLVRVLTRAAALADRALFFEVHELLEPVWFRAGEPVRSALQGLIQVAVALHHLGNGNLAGARALLADGGEKVEAAGASLSLDTGAWLGGLRATRAALVADRTPGPLPPWPRPLIVSRREET